MPNVIIKNEVGEEVVYEGIDSVTLRTDTGDTATYTYGAPAIQENYIEAQEFLAKTSLSSYNKTSINCTGCILFSSNSVDNFGLWLQTSFDLRKLSAQGCSYMYRVPGGALIAYQQSASQGIYFFNEKTYELTLLRNGGGQLYIYNIPTHPDKLLVCGFYGWYIFDTTAITLTPAYDFNDMPLTNVYTYATDTFMLLSLASSSSHMLGLWRFDFDTLEIRKIFNQGYSWLYGNWAATPSSVSFVRKVPGGILLSCSSYNTSTTSPAGGVLYYDYATDACTWIITEGAAFMNGSLITSVNIQNSSREYHLENGIVFCSTYSPAATYFFEYSTKTARKLSGTYFNGALESPDCLFLRCASSAQVVYVKATNEWHTLTNFTSSSVYTASSTADGVYICLSSPSSTYGSGVVYYDYATDTFTNITQSTYGTTVFQFVCAVEGGCYMSAYSDVSKGVCYYDATTQSLHIIDNTIASMRLFQKDGAILMAAHKGNWPYIALYKDGVLTKWRISQGTVSWDGCLDVQGGWLCSSHNAQNYLIHYVDIDTATQTSDNMGQGSIGIYCAGDYGNGNAYTSYYRYDDCYVKAYGKYLILSSRTSSYTTVYDTVLHEAKIAETWYNDSTAPSSTTNRYIYTKCPSFYEINPGVLLMISLDGYYAAILDTNADRLYLFRSYPCYVQRPYGSAYTSPVKFHSVPGGVLFLISPSDETLDTQGRSAARCVFHIRFSDYKLTCLRPDYRQDLCYTDFEDAPGGVYAYNRYTKWLYKLYWDNESQTATLIWPMQ